MHVSSAAASTTGPIASPPSERDPLSLAQTRLSRSLSRTQSSAQLLTLAPSNPDMRRAELIVEPDNNSRNYAHLTISRMEIDDNGGSYIVIDDVAANYQRPQHRQPAEESAQSVLDRLSDSDITLRADQNLKSRVEDQLASNQNIPLPVPSDSWIAKPLGLYHETLNEPAVLAWFESKGLMLETLIVHQNWVSGKVTRDSVSRTETFNIWDNSGWWQVSASVLAARQVLDPGDLGLTYVNEDPKLISRDVVLNFYGVTPPSSPTAINLVRDLRANGWPTLDKIKKSEALNKAKEFINDKKLRAQLIYELEQTVENLADHSPLSLSGRFSRSANNTPLADKCSSIVHHLNDFLLLPKMLELCKGASIDSADLPVRVSDKKIEVYTQSMMWEGLTDLVNNQSELKGPFEDLLLKVEETGGTLYSTLSLDLEQIVNFRGYGLPKTAGEVRNVIRWLRTSLPTAMPLGDFAEGLLTPRASAVTLTPDDKTKIMALTNVFLNGVSSIIDVLGAELFPDKSIEYRRINAEEMLEEMLLSDQANSSGQQLLQALGWYGASEGQTSSIEHRQQLLMAAIKLTVDPGAPGKPGTIAGYDIYQPKNLGRDLTVVRTEIEQHLIDQKGVSAQAAPLVAHLFLADVAPEFLAQDLREGIQVGTATWMTLSLGVAIAEVMDPGCSRVMTTEQLMALALLEPTTPEQQLLFKSLAVDISIKWAVMNGVIQWRADSSYSSEDYEAAASTFATQRKDLVQALEGFKRELVTRKELAAIELRKVFPSHLGKPMEEIIIGPRQIEEFGTEYKGETKSIVDAYMDGERSTPWEMCDVQMPDMDFDYGWSRLPDLNNLLTGSVDSFFNVRKEGLITSTKFLISTLPLEDRQSLELGEVRAFTLREETGKLKEDETPSIQAAFRGRQGTLLRCEHRDGEAKKVSYFEVFPGRISIIKRTDLPDVLPLDGVMETTKVKVSNGAPVNVTRQYGTELPFDFAAYATGSEPRADTKSKKLIIEELGKPLPAKKVNVNASTSVPNSYFSERTSNIVNRIINDNLLQGERDFLFEKAKGTTTEEKNRANREKWEKFVVNLIPFVGCTEDLRSGDRIRFINGAFGCFTDLASSLNTVAGGVGKLSNVLKSVAPIRVKAFEAFKLTGRTMVSMVNPLDGLPDLMAGGARTIGGFARLFKSGVFAVTKTGVGRLQTCTDRLRAFFGGFASGAAGTHLPNRMHTFVERVTGTVDGTDITAIRENGKWYALDKKGNPIGRALDNFIALTA